ncbi:uncharacterized protein LOC5569834 isoform X5 [Aedes aegypti]|uniref:Gustatory receptor n=1 Tax=Aedes aegypti TaxID=7159 RepID=A0A1S4FHZ7_AEDAE|nr:gustatory receptor 20 isoform l [Aedes aegypti]
MNIHDSYRPMEVLLKFLGMLPVCWPDNPLPKLKLCQKAVNLTNLLLNYSIAAIISSLYNSASMTETSDWTVHLQNNVITQTAVTAFPLVSITLGHAMANKIKQILRDVQMVDCKLALMSSSGINYHHQRNVTAAFSGMYIVIYSVLFLTSCAICKEPIELNIILIGSARNAFCLIVTTAQVLVIIRMVTGRYYRLNEAFRMYFPTTPSCGGFLSTTSHTETVICNEKEQLAVLKQIKILHDKLNDVVELVNYCFSVQITFCVGLCFVIGVVCSFGLFRAFIYRNELFYMGVLNFVWYMYYLFFVLFFIAVGSKITREGKRIGVLVHKAINCASSSAVINELNIFSQQLLHRSPVITCGLFVYDWTLLYTMIGATATYLIILIQFDVSFPNLVNVNGTQTAASGV